MRLATVEQMLIAVCIICQQVSGQLTFTVPKNKPAKVSTNYDPAENPVLANDGNTGGTYVPGVTCFHNGESDPLPWWMVDMQHIYLIKGAVVWNRLDSDCAPRFQQISIGVSSNPSVWTTFNTNLFDLCMYWTGVPTVSDNPINFNCTRPLAGRYLAVYKNKAGLPAEVLAFHFCEIDIIAFTKRPPYTVVEVQPSFSPTSSSLLVNSALKSRSDMECAILCTINSDCLFVLFRSASQECWLFGSVSIPSSFIGAFGSASAKFLAIYSNYD